MDETKTWWYRAIAKHSNGLFVFMMGCGVGAFGSVAAGAVSPGSDALRYYLGAITVLMGGALGIFGSRALDHMSDRRTLKRKIFSAAVRIQSLQYELVEFQDLVTKVTDNKPITDGGEKLSAPDMVECWQRMRRIAMTAKEAPELEDIVESDLDIHHAFKLNVVFRSLEEIYQIPSEAADVDELRSIVARKVGGAHTPLLIETTRETLAAADRHFRLKAEIDA